MERKEALELALRYVRQGYYVFPIKIDKVQTDEGKWKLTKTPLTEHSHQSATNNEAELVEQFRSAASANGVGLYPGPSGLLAVDVDIADGKRGQESLNELVVEFGKLPQTPMTISASGGRHIWFKKDGPVGNADLAKDINIRADDGWVVAPGTTTEWGSWKLEGNLGEAATWPDWMAEKLRGSASSQHDRYSKFDPANFSTADLEVLDVLRQLGGHTPYVANGAIQVMRPGKNGGRGASIGHIAPGVVKMFTDGWKTPDGLEFPINSRWNIDELRQFIETGDVPEQCLDGYKPKSAAEPTVLREAPKDFANRLANGFLNLRQLRELQPPEFLIRDLLVRNTIAQLVGDPGKGKTFVAVDWMMRIASGTDWFDYKVKQAETVLYIAAEGAAGLQYRVEAWEQHHDDIIVNEENIIVLPFAVNLTDAEQVAAFLPHVQRIKPALIVIDTQSRSTVGADENSAKDVGVMIDHADQIRRASGACVLLVHHTGHAEKGRGRGSSVGRGAVDTELILDGSLSDGLQIKVGKQKDSEEITTYTFYAETVNLDSIDEDGYSRNSLVLVKERTQERIGEKEKVDTGPDVRVLMVRDALRKIQQGDGMSSSQWLGACIEMCIPGISQTAKSKFYEWSKECVKLGMVIDNRQPGKSRSVYWATEE